MVGRKKMESQLSAADALRTTESDGKGGTGLEYKNGTGIYLHRWAALGRDELLGEIISHGFERKQLSAGVWVTHSEPLQRSVCKGAEGREDKESES